MSELVPSVLLHGQALKLLEEIEESRKVGSTSDVQGLIELLATVLARYEENAGKPLIRYEEVSETEPPSSEKMNRFWSSVEKDVNLMQQQSDILRAAVVFMHNMVATEISRAYKENARVNNKLKTLQLYSNGEDASIVSFGDSFESLDFIDQEYIPDVNRPTLQARSTLTLGVLGEVVNLSNSAGVRILESSNGFVGNNQEVEDPKTAPRDPETNETHYTFKVEGQNVGRIQDLKDGEPNTWFEYEQYEVEKSDRLSAKNLNFVYTKTDDDGDTVRVNWAKAVDTLRLGLEFDFGNIENINSVSIVPYGLEGNKNYPILVRKIQTSANGTDWTKVFPTDVHVSTEVNLKAARAADNVMTQEATWQFGSRPARYVRVYIEQRNPIECNIGHVYWIATNDKGIETRVEGPDPRIEAPYELYGSSAIGDFVQRREVFRGKRWAIALRDINIEQIQYTEKSIIITKPLRIGGVIDRVMLERADVSIPPEYPPDETWVKFFISPDEGENWYPISQIEDTNNDIPEQISFNDPIDEAFRELTVKNYVTEEPVTSIRMKVEMTRPASMPNTTPILRSYALKVKRR